MINLHNEDCMEALRGMGDKVYDLAIVDPPYGCGDRFFSGGNTKNGNARLYIGKKWNESIPNQEYINELFRVSKNQIIWGGNYFSLPGTRGVIVWDKGQTLDSYSDGEYAWTSFDSPLKIFRYVWNGFCQGIQGRSSGSTIESRIHPTQKPVALYKWLLTRYARPGMKILDTHLGSGSIAIACHDLGYDLDGWELDPDYYRGAVDRLKLHQSQGTLFDPAEKREPKEEELF